MLGLRSKLLFGLGGFVMIVLAVSLLAETVMDYYSRKIGQSRREDYDSVAACQSMKEAVEQMDLYAQDALWDRPVDPQAVRATRDRFEQHLADQREAATLPGEKEATDQLASLWHDYLDVYSRALVRPLPTEQRRQWYLTGLLPQSRQVRLAAQSLIDMNLAALLSVPGKAQRAARTAHWAMRALTISALALAVLFSGLIGRIILRPVRVLTNFAHEVEGGNLDLSVPVQSRDELGALGTAFNTMARKLRTYRQIAHERLVRTEQTTQLAIDSLPDAVLVINPEGKVELANEVARRLLCLMPGDNVESSSLQWLADLWRRIAHAGHATELSDYESIVQIDVDGEARQFLPRTAPILDESRRPIGATVVLADVTGLRRLDEMKNTLLSLVSHELKTPLTSARMILHLITDQKLGPLTPKQSELLSAARDETDRLHQIVENLLDMSRIESGRALMELEPVTADDLIRRSIEPLSGMFQSQQVSLEAGWDSDLPAVWADPARIGHVFANLLMNSLRYTPAGGRVTVGARKRADGVEFVIHDTGPGIPRQYLHRVFEKFFRVPGQPGGSGSGLGLAIARDVIEAHGGQIRAESGEGTGATFAFTLRAVANRTDGPPSEPTVLPAASVSEANDAT